MKLFVISALIVLSFSRASAQNSLADDHEKAALILARSEYNKVWGWFHPTEWIEDVILGRPGWQRISTKHGTDGWKWTIYASMDSTAYTEVSFYEDTVAGYHFCFFNDTPNAANWITEKFKQVARNEWEDREDNALIYRTYNGYYIVYEVRYFNFNKK